MLFFTLKAQEFCGVTVEGYLNAATGILFISSAISGLGFGAGNN